MNKASFLFFLKILFTSLVFYFLLNKLDFTLVKTNLGKLSSKAFIFSICWVWIGIATSAKRWQEIMACNFQKLPFLELWRQTIIGSFLNQCLPSSVGGDVYRGYMAKRHGLSTEWAISSTLIDRLYGLMSLVLLGVLALPFEFSTLLQSYLGLSIIICLLATFVGFILLVFFPQYSSTVLKEMALIKPLMLFSQRLYSTLTQNQSTFNIFLFSMITASGLIIPLYTTSISMNLSLTFSQILVSLPFIFLVSVLPVSFAGWGLREGAMVATLGLFGISKEEAFCLSVVFGLIQLIASLPGIFIWVAYRSPPLSSQSL
jgi:uncharacterized protein (TIRG00374 family)